MKIESYRAIIKYDPEIEMFRGEFIGLNGGADFYANNINDLKKEGSISLNIFLAACKKRGIKAKKEYSGNFNVRISKKLHIDIATLATIEGKSINQLIIDVLDNTIQA